MVTLGDVFTVIAILFGVCFTAWAMIIGAAVLFQSSASSAREAYRVAPWKNFGIGILISLSCAIVSISFLKVPMPGMKLLGMTFLLAWMSLSAIGASGVAMLMADRICALDPSVARYTAILRACAILVIAAVFPVLGWFLVGPALIVASTGYGFRALIASHATYASEP